MTFVCCSQFSRKKMMETFQGSWEFLHGTARRIFQIQFSRHTWICKTSSSTRSRILPLKKISEATGQCRKWCRNKWKFSSWNETLQWSHFLQCGQQQQMHSIFVMEACSAQRMHFDVFFQPFALIELHQSYVFFQIHLNFSRYLLVDFGKILS